MASGDASDERREGERTPGRRLVRAWRWWQARPRRVRIWWGSGLGLMLLIGLLESVAEGGCLQVLCTVLFTFWLIGTAGWIWLRVWRRLTYRIGVRLLISYLLIGILPFPMLALLGGAGLYLLLGQYASSELGDLSDQLGEELAVLVRSAVAAGESGAAARLADGPELGAPVAAAAAHVRWLAAVGDRVERSSPDSRMPLPSWVGGELESGPFLTPEGPVLAALASSGQLVVAAWVPLDAAASRSLSAERWFEARFLEEAVEVESERQPGIVIREVEDEPELGETGSVTVSVNDEPIFPADAEEEKGADGDEPLFTTALSGEGLWKKRWIFFVRLSPEVRRWETGESIAERALATFVTTSPEEVLGHLFRSPYRIGAAVWGTFMLLSAMLGAVYLAAAALAAILVMSIARSTSRLTRGARQVEAGDLDGRIPVRRRDQLGDLAIAFNRMTESVQGMLAEVAEKERLKSELQLAREIQQSLLPAPVLRHGSVVVHAHFRPAAEVGGDYFDLFPLEGGRLLVAAGDVAGHGLPTGLLMAMVKSAVATLVYDGYRGVELLERLNRFMLDQPRRHRMLTLALAEVDPAAGVVEISNAAHPPLFLTGDEVREVVLPALPIGFAWSDPPPSCRLELEPQARLIFYSDGLVEASDAADEPFGYARLHALLDEHRSLPSEELLARMLTALEEHVGERPLADDLTLLIIDCGTAGAQ